MSVKTNHSVTEGVLVFSLEGKLIEEDAFKGILSDIESRLAQVGGKLILNIEKLKHINSVGINFFIKALTKARVNNGDMILNGAKGEVLSVIKIAKMDEVFTMTDKLEDALIIFKDRK